MTALFAPFSPPSCPKVDIRRGATVGVVADPPNVGRGTRAAAVKGDRDGDAAPVAVATADVMYCGGG